MLKYLQNGYPEYLKTFLKPKHSGCNIFESQANVPYFATSVYKSTKHFGLSFVYGLPKTWNVHSATKVSSFREKLKTYLFAKAYST